MFKLQKIRDQNREQKSTFKENLFLLKEHSEKERLRIPLGFSEENKLFFYDLKMMPHLLIAGQTGSGKSQFLHNIALSLIGTKTQDELKLIIIDPKCV